MDIYNERVALFEQDCSSHDRETANLICIHPSCLHNGLICKMCKLTHRDHIVLNVLDFLDILKNLVNYEGTHRIPHQIDNLIAKTTSSMMAIVEELEELLQLFKMRLEVNDFLLYCEKKGNRLVFKDLLQGVVSKLAFKNDTVVVNSINSIAGDKLYMPNGHMVTSFLELYHERLVQMRHRGIEDFTIPKSYDVLDLKFNDGLVIQENPDKQLPVTIERQSENLKEEAIVEKFIYDRPDTNQSLTKKLQQRTRAKMIPSEFEGREGSERIEKVQIVMGSRVWYLDLIYLKFKTKNWVFEPRHGCLICKCHPKFARIKEYLHVKYGELYGPVSHEKNLHLIFKQAVANRKDKGYLVERSGLYFHDLCIYWSNLIECDEKRGIIDFDTFAHAVKVSQEIRCHLCQRIGPTLKCNHPECDIWIHYYCFKDLDPGQQYVDTVKFRILCPRHIPAKYIKPPWLFANSFLEKLEQEGYPIAYDQKVKTQNEQEQISGLQDENEDEDYEDGEEQSEQSEALIIKQ